MEPQPLYQDMRRNTIGFISIAGQGSPHLSIRGLANKLVYRRRYWRYASELEVGNTFTCAPQTQLMNPLEFTTRSPPSFNRRLSFRRLAALRCALRKFVLLPSPLRQSYTPDSFPTPPTSPRRRFGEISSLSPLAKPFFPLLLYTPTPMDRRRGALPVGNNVQNSVPTYQQLSLQQQPSFGSNNSADSNDSFRTQVPLSYHLAQDNQQANNFTVNSGFVPYAQTGSNGSSTSLNPNSSPYIPQGNTPTLSSAGFCAQSWGVPLIPDGGNHSMATTYQQQEPSQRSNNTQYQGGTPYQQPGGAQYEVNRMSPHLRNAFDNGSPYGRYGPGFAAPNNAAQYNTAKGQMSFNSFASPEPVYATTMVPYAVGFVDQPANAMYNSGASNKYGHQDMYSSQMHGSISFPAPPGNAYTGSNSANTSLSSAPSNTYNKHNQIQGRNSTPGPQSNKIGRSDSVVNTASTMRFQKKSFATSSTSDGKEHQNSSRSSHKRSGSSTPHTGGPVQALQGARGASPEKVASVIGTPKSSRKQSQKSNNQSWIVEDTSTVLTPVSKPHPTDAGLFSLTENRTPQLRSRRGQTITSASNTAQKISIGEWVGAVRRAPEAGVMSGTELRGRGSPMPTNALSLITLNDTHPFVSSQIPADTPFDCMAPGRFTAGFGSGPLSHELMTLTQGGTRNPTVAQALDHYNVPFSEYCRQAKSDNFGVIRIKNVCIRTVREPSLLTVNRFHIVRAVPKSLPSLVGTPDLSTSPSPSQSISSWSESQARRWIVLLSLST